MDTRSRYVHGYDPRESERLNDQAGTLLDLLHQDTRYPSGSVLEAGCGVGAQTVILAGHNPGAQITSIDLSSESLALARQAVTERGLENVDFLQADIHALPFAEGTFDHVFVCFVLEHLSDPVRALIELRRVLRPGGSLTAIEGDHGSTFFYPDSTAAHRTIDCLVELQRIGAGNALIGRQLFPLLTQAGYEHVQVSPRFVYVDAAHPELVRGFTHNTFIAMVEGVRDEALGRGLIDRETWDAGIAGLERTTREDGVFCYTFFKGTASA